MSKRTTILLHLAAWAILFLAPLSFLNHGNGVSLPHYLTSCISTVVMMVVFYTNYFWLTPNYFVTGEKRVYWLVNAILCIGGGLLIHICMTYAHGLLDETERPHYIPTLLQSTMFVMRDIFNLIIAAGIATMILLAIRWNESEEARLEAEAARTDAELSNLRSQINPHFLLNTLNNIYALTAFDTERAQNAIQQLSKMLRHILYDYQENEVPLEDEVQFLENYIALMKLRLPQTVEIKSEFNVKHTQAKVAPMIFISLVENAFKHGISPTEPCFIHISIEADSQTIACNISNSNHPKTAMDHSGHGIGLSQVQRRLELTYPNRYTWEKGLGEDQKTYESKIMIRL